MTRKTPENDWRTRHAPDVARILDIMSERAHRQEEAARERGVYSTIRQHELAGNLADQARRFVDEYRYLVPAGDADADEARAAYVEVMRRACNSLARESTERCDEGRTHPMRSPDRERLMALGAESRRLKFLARKLSRGAHAFLARRAAEAATLKAGTAPSTPVRERSIFD